MPGDSKSSRGTPSVPTESEKKSGAGGDLQMTPEQMLDLAHKAVKLVVEWAERLPGENAWDGDFRQGLEDQLLKGPPEAARPPAEVLEQAARNILPFAIRHAHAALLRVYPVVAYLAECVGPTFMAAGYNINTVTWLVASGPEPA